MKDNFLYFILFGLPTWALVDGTWASLSQLANTLPEGYDISAYLILCLTIGNIFPLMIGYYLQDAQISELSIIIKFILVAGFVTGILMCGLWQYTIPIGQDEYSVPLYILFFIVGACSSSSNVTHYTFVSTYIASNTTALGTGMGIGSMIAGLLGILQGLVLIDYGFTTTYYYLILALLYIPAYYSFHHLFTSMTLDSPDKALEHITHPIEPMDDTDMEVMLTSTGSSSSSSTYHHKPRETVFENYHFVIQFRSLLFMQLLIASLGYGMVPAIISYACGKFSSANFILLLATGISAMIDPWCKMLTFVLRWKALTSLQGATLTLFLLTLGLFICASQPTDSTLYTSQAGGALPVILYVCFNALFGFTTISIFRYFKEHAAVRNEDIIHAYRWNGIASQTGALLGSILAFALVISNSLE